MRKIGRITNGWNLVTENIGTYGTSYTQRAIIEDALYPTAFVDAKGLPLSGANK